ncbi:nuclease-related domain-containing protein [Duganella sp. BuS-21]|uniref:nuclease-related domain-containing protein n=1 Tax=Duganella sp. BuS-21 TaxID=2943848 RepID=UPI0035A69166
MAHLHPTGWQEMSGTGAAAREIETLTYLKAALAEEPYRIYHGVHWTNVENGFSAYDEIDFIIVAPNGRVLLVEQKSGFLNETPEGLVKNYAGKPRKVANHIMRSIKGLTERFGGEMSIDYLL